MDMSQEEEIVDCDFGECIILSDQTSLIESLIQYHAILRAEAPQCLLIDSEFEINFSNFNTMSSNLTNKLVSLVDLADRLPDGEKQSVIIFAVKVQRSRSQMIKKLTDEYAGFFVASKTNYGLPLTSLLCQITTELSTIQLSLAIGEELYDKEYVIKGRIYCNEIANLLKTMQDCDEKVQQYLILPKLSSHLEELDAMIESFAARTNLLPSNHGRDDDLKVVFSAVSSLLSGEIFGWLPVNPKIIIQNNSTKKPVFITKNNRRTQIKSLRNLPLFHG